MTDKKLAGRTALVFGAGSIGPGWGNGKAAAVAYARAGARVLSIDRDKAAAEETAHIIEAEGGTVLALACDVTKLDAVKRVATRAKKEFETLDILHNNVGHAGMGGPIELTEEQWLREMDINLNSMFRTVKAVLPVMLAQRRGVITNISSSAGLRYTGYPYASYYASKGGVNQFSVGLGVQYARDGIRCNAILPGLMDTPLIYAQIAGQYKSVQEMQAARHAATPPGRMGTAWDVAHAAVFLASDEAQYINAVCLPVDGGLTARCVCSPPAVSA
jgi:NAD(P)-dependent dehydrogenase (short-subunit alcohol dehydrogenase family)